MKRLAALLTCFLAAGSLYAASEIREFDLKTVEKLGREMNRISQRANKGATGAVRKRAQRTAIDALKGRLVPRRERRDSQLNSLSSLSWRTFPGTPSSRFRIS